MTSPFSRPAEGAPPRPFAYRGQRATPVSGARDFAGLPVSLSTDSMDAGQATELLAVVEQLRAEPAGVPDSATTTAHTVSVEDLSETELRTLLRIMESSEEAK